MEGALDLFAMVSALQDEDTPDTCPRRVEEVDCLIASWKEDRRLVGLTRVHQDDLSVEEFRNKFEAKGEPVLLEGCSDSWRCNDWSIEDWKSRFGGIECALYTGQTFPMGEYIAYCFGRGETDDSPLYLFEDLSLAKEDESKFDIISSYTVPKFFHSDLFRLTPQGLENVEASVNPVEQVTDDSRPRFRWLLIGPARSGTKIHTDPISTSAWNTLLIGHKRWVLLPPSISEEQQRMIKGPKGGEALTVEQWFLDVLPELRKEGLPVVEFTQRPGETIFVPAGWWHIVINLDLTLAVTQNFASTFRVDKVLEAMRSQPTSSFKSQWFKRMRTLYPEKNVCESCLPSSFVEGSQHKLVRPMESGKKNLWSNKDEEWLSIGAAKRYDKFAREFLWSSDETPKAQTIPRVLHFIWLGERPIPQKESLLNSWRSTHLRDFGWDIRLWNDKNIKSLEVTQSKAYNTAPNVGAKSDLVRLAILEKYGGVYVDIDFKSLCSLEHLIQSLEAAGVSFAAGMSNVGAIEVNNGLIIAAPHDCLVKRLLERACENLLANQALQQKNGLLTSILDGGFLSAQDTQSTRSVMSSDVAMMTIRQTGPGLLSQILIEEWDSFPNALVLPPLVFYPLPNTVSSHSENDDLVKFPACSIAVHYWLRSWCSH